MTSPCAGNPQLSTFDCVLCHELSKILNVEFNDSQWKQASLPVQIGGLGVRSACMLAPSAFVASAAATLSLQNAIYQNRCMTQRTRRFHSLWHRGRLSRTRTNLSVGSDTSSERGTHRWHVTSCDTVAGKARLKAVEALHAGDWLNALPLSAIGLLLSDEAIRVAV